MPKDKCPKCGDPYFVGYNGVIEGHDDCLGVSRDNEEYAWRDGEQVKNLMDVDTGEVETRTRRKSLRWW